MALILVTDDSKFLRRRTISILTAAGHQTVEACHGIECIEQLPLLKPELIFLDLVMPELDGIGVLKQLKQDNNRIPVIVLTADIQASVKKECLELGAIAFINKPPKEDEVLGAIDLALGCSVNR